MLYQNSFENKLWLKGWIKDAGHAIDKVGDEKDGQLVIEKVITKNRFRAKMHVNKSMHMVFQRLPNHATVTFIDQYGVEFIAINVEVMEPRWERLRGLMEINFNDEDSIIVTKETNDNIA